VRVAPGPVAAIDILQALRPGDEWRRINTPAEFSVRHHGQAALSLQLDHMTHRFVFGRPELSLGKARAIKISAGPAKAFRP
jgi:hypothetical protein